MAEQSPWSIKGVDRKTREQMKKIAQETGVTLGELLSDLLAKQAEQNNNALKKSKETIQKLVPPATETGKKTVRHAKDKGMKQDNIVPMTLQKNNKSQDKPILETAVKKKNVQKQTSIALEKEESVQKKSKIETPKSLKVIPKKSSEAKQKLFIPKDAIRNTLFNDLLKKNTPHGQPSDSSQVMHHKMPADILQDIVFEGRDLRDALRAHTSELTKEIRNQVDASIEIRLQEIKTIITEISQARLAEQEHIIPQQSEEELELRKNAFLNEAKKLVHESLEEHLHSVKEMLASQQEEMFVSQADNGMNITDLSHKLRSDMRDVMSQIIGQATHHSIEDADTKKKEFLSDINHLIQHSLKEHWNSFRKIIEARQNIAVPAGTQEKFSIAELSQQVREDVCEAVTHIMKQMAVPSVQDNHSSKELFLKEVNHSLENALNKVIPHLQELFRTSAEGKTTQIHLAQTDIETLSHQLHQDMQKVMAETLKQTPQKDTEALRQDMQNFMTKIGSSLLESVDVKINTLIGNALLANAENGKGDISLEMATVRDLRTNSEVILGRLSQLEEVCHHLDKKIQQNIEKNTDYSELYNMRDELKNFIMDIPHRIQEVFEKPNENIKSIALSMHALAERIETVGHLAKRIPEMPEMAVEEVTSEPEALMTKAPAKDSLKHAPIVSHHIPQFQDDEFDTVPEGGEFSEDILADLQNAERNFMASGKKKPENESFLEEEKPKFLVKESPSMISQEQSKETSFTWNKAHKLEEAHKELEAFADDDEEEDVYDAQFYEDDEQEQQKEASHKDKNSPLNHNALHDEWDEADLYDEDDETEEDYLGFAQEENLKKSSGGGVLSDKISSESPDIRAMDRATIMYKTRRSALNEMHKRDKNYDPKLDKMGGLMANFYNPDNQRNAMIVGGLALMSLVLMGVLFLF